MSHALNHLFKVFGYFWKNVTWWSIARWSEFASTIKICTFSVIRISNEVWIWLSWIWWQTGNWVVTIFCRHWWSFNIRLWSHIRLSVNARVSLFTIFIVCILDFRNSRFLTKSGLVSGWSFHASYCTIWPPWSSWFSIIDLLIFCLNNKKLACQHQF